jgi:hypothetical protein
VTGALLTGARAAYGVVQLVAPGWSGEALLGGGLDTTSRRAVRLLGARQVVQASVSAARPMREVLVLGAVVDGLHAASMVGLAVGVRRYRRPAMASAAIAAAFTIAGALSVRSSSEV